MSWLGTYKSRIELKIDHTKIDSPLTHFPVTLFLDSRHSGVFDEVGDSYKKIALTKDDGVTQLYAEVEEWDSSNKKAVLHVSKSDWTISSTEDTVFYLYYDSSAEDNTGYIGDPGDSVAANVWDDNFAGVWHLSQDPTGGAGCIKDSTGNNNDGTPQGSMTSDDLVDGKVGKALNFDGSDDYIDCGNDASITGVTNNFTMELWARPQTTHGIDAESTSGTEGTSGQRYAIGAAHGDNTWGSGHAGAGVSIGTNGISVYEHADGYMPALLVYQGDITEWNHIVIAYVDKQPRLYLNGVSVRTGLTSPKAYVHPGLYNDDGIGGMSYGHFDGLIDEVRISNAPRSDAWIKATYYSLFNELVYTREEPTEWSYRKIITISGSPGAGTEYQVLLKVGESSGVSGCDFHVEGHSGKFPSGTNDSGDLRFVDNDGTTFLNFWVEKVEGTLPNRVAYCWVKINDNLDSDVDIYCYYGNPEAGNVSNGVATFDWFDDFSPDRHDWLVRAGTWSNVNGAKKGVHDGSADRNSLADDQISLSDFVLEANVKSSVDGSLANIVVRAADTDNDSDDRIWIRFDQRPVGARHDGGFHLFENVAGSEFVRAYYDFEPTVDQWYKIQVRFHGSSAEGYLDGTQRWSTTSLSRTAAGYILLQVEYQSGHDAWFDNIFVRKYAATEPSFSSAGAEERLLAPTYNRFSLILRNKLYSLAYGSEHFLVGTINLLNRITGSSIVQIKNHVFTDKRILLANRVASDRLVQIALVQHWDGPEGDYRFVPSSTRERPWWWWPYSRGEAVPLGQEGINYTRISKDRRFDEAYTLPRLYHGVRVSEPYTQIPTFYDGKQITDKPRNFFWSRVYVIPTKIDFGFTKIGSTRQIYILHRHEESSHNLQSVTITDPSFTVTLPEALPFTMAPGYELPGTVNVAQVGAVRVIDAPIYFNFDTVGSAAVYVSATFAIVLLKPKKYDLWNTPHTFQKIKFRFETEIINNLASKPTRVPKLLYPVRSSSLQLGAVDEVAFDLDYDAINAARYLVVVPEFPLRVRLASNASQHDTQIVVTDVTDFEVGYSAVLCSTQNIEAMNIVEIDEGTNTLKFSGQLQYGYSMSSTWVYPSFTGFGHVRRTRSLVKHNVYNLEIDVDEIIPSDCNELTGSTSTWYVRPKTVVVEGSVVDSRDVKNLEVGVPSIKNPLSDRIRDKIRVTHVYQLLNKDWRNFKDLFLYAKGRYRKVNIITWLSDLHVYEDAPQDAASIKVRPKSYSEIWGYYKDIVVDYGGSTLETRVSAVVAGGDYCVLSLEDTLPKDTPAGTPIHFKINAYLTEDAIEFDFKGDVCFITATWEESYD